MLLCLRSVIYSLIALLRVTRSDSSESDIYSCPRIRKAWHLTSEDEKQLFIKGIHQLNDEGKFKYFAATHSHSTDSNQAHNTAALFAWHRYFLWEFENQIRSLGAEYECFSIPYWDATTDSGLLDHAYVFQSGLGGVGSDDIHQCVNTEPDASWSVDNFPLEHDTWDTSAQLLRQPSNACCLQRAVGWMDLSAVSSYTDWITSEKTFGTGNGFRHTAFTKYHSELHSFVGGTMTSKYSAQDPLFYLIHSWFDYIFVVWKQCQGYNHIDASDLDTHSEAYAPWPLEPDSIPASGLDDILYYIPMDEIVWWEGDVRNPTVRSTWDETQWNIQYERGSFIERSHLSSLCDNEWDTDVLLENSVQTKSIMEASQTLQSDVDRYQQITWDYIQQNIEDEYEESEYIQTWDAKTCNFQRQSKGKEPCYIPPTYEKCTTADFERRDEITMEELLNKEGVKGNACLEEVRIQNYAWFKSVGMVYELCMGHMDQYFVCNAPIIEFMVDGSDDDKVYYEKLHANKERMKQEALVHGNIKEMDSIQQESQIMEGIGNYPRFDVFGYLIMAFMIGGCAFIALIVNCAGECNGRIHSKGTSRHNMDDSLRYGSMIEML